MRRIHSKDLSRITTLSFDGDDTLWDFDEVMRRALGFSLAELRRWVDTDRAAELTVDEMIEIRDEVAQDSKGQNLKLEEIRLRAFQRTVEFVGAEDDDLARRLNATYRKHRYGDTELYPDVLPALDALAPRFRLGLLSNGNTSPERCGLQGRFGFVVFAQDVGFEKPDPRIFEFALKQAGCSPGELLHVGDSLETDAAGARNAGIRSVWLNRNDGPNDTGIEPDFEIRTLAELPAILGP